MLLTKSEFNDRDNLPEFLNEKGLTGNGIEIGTHQADYASMFYRKWDGNHFTCVDPWLTTREYYEQSKMLWNSDPDNRELDYDIAKKKMEAVGKPCTFLKMFSHDAAEKYDDEHFDFVYLDGNHEYEFVKQDLALWWPKVKPGGILAGHDFVCPGEDEKNNWGAQIQPALFWFAGKHDLTIHIIVESKWLPWSYYIRKSDK